MNSQNEILSTVGIRVIQFRVANDLKVKITIFLIFMQFYYDINIL